MRRKVLFVIWSFSYGGGAERVLSHLVRGLQETGYFDISLLEISHFDKAWEKLPEEVKVLSPVFDETAQGFFARGKRFAKRKLFDLSPAWARRMSRRAGGYDVVVAFNYLLPTFLIYLCKSIWNPVRCCSWADLIRTRILVALCACLLAFMSECRKVICIFWEKATSCLPCRPRLLDVV